GGGALRMLERTGVRGKRLTAAHETLGHALQLEELRGAIALARIHDRGEVRNLVRQLIGPAMNLPADLEKAKRRQMPTIVGDVAQDSGQEAGAHEFLIGGNGIADAHMIVGGKTELGGGAFGDEGVVVDLGEAL